MFNMEDVAYPTHTLESLCERSHQIACDHGFGEAGKVQPYYRDFNLFLSETAEALEDLRANKRLREVWYEYRGSSFSAEEISHTEDPPRSAFKPCGIKSELADVVIRVCHRVGSMGLGRRLDETFRENTYIWRTDDLEALLAFVNYKFAKVYEATLEYDDGRPRKAYDIRSIHDFAVVLRTIFCFCEENNMDLWAAIDEKEAFNRNRPLKHGNKAF